MLSQILTVLHSVFAFVCEREREQEQEQEW